MFTFVCAASLATFLVSESAAPDRQPPNIVLIVADDLGWADLGCMGSRFYATPHIDRLARQGMTFTSAYSNGPNCAPTRACLMSGKYTPRHGVFTVGDPWRGPHSRRRLIPVENKTVLAREEVALAEAVGAAGFTSAHVGKWHLGGSGFLPTGQGFDVNHGGSAAGSPAGGYFLPNKMDLPEAEPGEYLTDHLTDRALEFLEDNRAGPFFLHQAYHAVHTPIQPKPDYKAKYAAKEVPEDSVHDNPAYAAMIQSLDEGVGRILAKLDALGVADNTVVIFYSDNGGVGGYHRAGIKAGEITDNAPLKAGKGTLYEGGVRVPLIVRWPGVVEPGSRCDVPVISVDFYPTLLQIAGTPGDPDHKLDGQSIVPLLKQSGGWDREAIYWHFPAYLQGRGGSDRTTPAGAIRSGPWKLIEVFEDGRLELYHLADDISEKQNLAEAMPEKAEQLHEMLCKWRTEVEAPMPQPNPDFVPAAKNRKAGRQRAKRK